MSDASNNEGATTGRKRVQAEADRILRHVLLRDKRLQLPAECEDLATEISFDPAATPHPVLPTPLKMTESSSALWALLSIISNAIVKDRFAIQQKGIVNTDASTLYLMSSMLVSVNGKPLSDPDLVSRYIKYDRGRSSEAYRRLATNIYPTRDERYFHLHGSMDASATLSMLGMEDSRNELDEKSAIQLFISKVREWDSSELDRIANDEFNQAGTICLTPEEFKQSEQGVAVAKSGLYDLEKMPGADTAIPWPENKPGSLRRPLEGIKMLDLSRVIAAPTIAKIAALFGATVVRVSFDGNPDMGPLLVDGNLGKRDVNINLKSEDGKFTLRRLIQDCDIFLDGYRPGALCRLGFGPDEVRRIAEEHGRSIVYVRENCYGWSGPLSHRSGWQQISDCVTGASYLQGLFLGLNEPVVPLIPNSDYQTGLIGLIGIMVALVRRQREGGSYLLSVALNYYNHFLLSLGQQESETQSFLRDRHKTLQLRHYDDMLQLAMKTFKSIQRADPQIFNDKYFQTLPARLGKDGEMMRFVGSPVTFEQTHLQYDIGSCFCGKDQAEWV